MEKSFSVKKPLKILLDIAYWAGLIGIILGIPYLIFILVDKPSFLPFISTKSIIFSCVESVVYLLIVCELRKIMNNIIKTTPFTLENVRCFKKISMYIIIAAFVNLNSIVSYLVLAGTILVIAEVLEKAVQIKAENDLTV